MIESDDGFSVEVLFPSGLLYVEGECKMHIISDFLVGPDALALYSDSVKSWAGNECASISDEKKARIIDNIREAFRFRGFEIHVR